MSKPDLFTLPGVLAAPLVQAVRDDNPARVAELRANPPPYDKSGLVGVALHACPGCDLRFADVSPTGSSRGRRRRSRSWESCCTSRPASPRRWATRRSPAHRHLKTSPASRAKGRSPTKEARGSSPTSRGTPIDRCGPTHQARAAGAAHGRSNRRASRVSSAFISGSSRNRVGNFHSFGSMQVRIFSRKYSSSR